MASVHVERTGVVRDEKTGETFIPASRRPDGTWRKPRRVKDGYIPQEEVPVYESKGMQWLNSMPTLPPGLNPIENEVEKSTKTSKKQKKSSSESQKQILRANSPEFIAQKVDSLIISNSQKNINTNCSTDDEFKVVSSKKNKSKTKTASKTTSLAVESEKTKQNLNKKGSKSKKTENNATTEGDAQTDPAKRLRNLKKKIRQIEELEEKIKTKELPNPSQEQLEKVARKNDIKKEIEKLELIV